MVIMVLVKIMVEVIVYGICGYSGDNNDADDDSSVGGDGEGVLNDGGAGGGGCWERSSCLLVSVLGNSVGD